MPGLVATPSARQPTFAVTGLAVLPLTVQTAGIVLASGDEFRIWVNRPGETVQLRVTASRHIAELPTLPIVAAGAAACSTGFAVTGSDAQGRPVVLVTNADGSVRSHHRIDGPEPLQWPVPVCTAEQLRVVWQTGQRSLEVANVADTGISNQQTFKTGGPPLQIACAEDAIWVVWSEASALSLLRIQNGSSRVVQIPSPSVSEFAVGRCGSRVCLATLQNNAISLTSMDRDGNSLVPLNSMTLAGNVQGNLALVPCEKPLIWIQGAVSKGNSLHPRSILLSPDLHPVEVDGLVFSIATKDHDIVLLGATEILFLSA